MREGGRREGGKKGGKEGRWVGTVTFAQIYNIYHTLSLSWQYRLYKLSKAG